MIKTMLLTAQLALSPIVGTNGLQPKRLPNPVYGEEVNLSVTYNGETYTRLAYENDQENWLIDFYSNWAGVNFNLKGINTQGDQYTVSNMGTGDDTQYIFMYKESGIVTIDEVMGQNLCVSFYGKYDSGYVYYELFAKNTYPPLQRQFIYTPSTQKWEEDETITEDNLGYNPITISSAPIDNLPVCTLGNIPQNQPTIANPSVYDNIYNFYYQNLFANEALDELGAEVGGNSLTMRQWLAHTATIVSISLLAVALAVLVVKIFKLIAGSISDIWG